jgi:hypothetical protein
MSGISNLQNTCIYTLGPTLSGQVSDSLQSQITGKQNMQKHQVNQAIYIDSNTMIAKTGAALQNVAIASQFCNTTVAGLQTVEESLTDALNAVITLLNGTVSDANKQSAADSIIGAIGMKQSAVSRDGQEGAVIKTLRQSGTGVSPFYSLSTKEGKPATPQSAPPKSVEMPAEKTYMFLNGIGTIPADTFASAKTVQFTNFDENDRGDIDNDSITVIGTGLTDLQFNLPINGVTYTSEHLDINNSPGKPINLYHPDDKSKYVTFFATPTVTTGVTDIATATAAFKALFHGRIDTEAVPNETAVFTHTGAAPTDTFADPSDTPPRFSGVEPGAIQVLSATLAQPSQLAIQVGSHVYATSDLDNLDIHNITGTGTDITLYLDGDKANKEHTIKLKTLDISVSGAMASSDVDLVAALTTYMDGTFTIPPVASSNEGVFMHDGTPVPTGGLLPCNPTSFENVTAGPISVVSTSYKGVAGTSTGTDVLIEIKVGEDTYKTDPAAGGDTIATGGTITLFKDGDNASAHKINLTTGPIASAPPVAPATIGTGIYNEETLSEAVTAALSGSYMPFGEIPFDTPFAFTPGSNYGAGYFTLKYDGQNVHFYDQFDDIVQSFPVSEESILDSVANNGGKLPLGNIGTLYTNSTYKGGSFEKHLVATPSKEFSTIVTVSGNDGARRIIIPNLTDQETLYGVSTKVDHDKLVRDTGYQKEIKGMIEHALEKVKETIQYVSNISNSLAADERGQNASMSSLHNLKNVVSEADPIETANAVFTNTQAYNNMVNAMYIASTITAQQSRSSLQIAQLAASA